MFRRTRITLTAWYLLIIMTISLSFSTVVFTMISREVEQFARSQRYRIERQLNKNTLPLPNIHTTNPPLPLLTDPDLVNETKHRLFLTLILINSAIFVVSGGLGYMLAGITLLPIREMMDEQNQFITDASHELRTPLTSLKSTIEVNLRDKNLTLPQAKSILSDNMEDVNKLQQLSEGLLLLAQYQKPNNKTVRTRIILDTVVKNAIRNVSPQAAKKNIRIKNIGHDGYLIGNTFELTDLLVVILDNAIKYSKERTGITVTTRSTGGIATIAIKDQGIGIKKDDIPHIFDRFYRTDSARTKPQTGGFGLGLSIAKKIVDQYHGSIHVISQPGKGSEFIVRLPAQQG